LARIALTREEAARFQGELETVVQNAAKIAEVDVSGVEPTVYGGAGVNVFREDSVEPSAVREQALEMAPGRHGNEFKLPKIVEDA
jgi:aspartyl-tRNA(Asn)/glutamyl-tRNA(Gln) amidotransferase subunit C